MIPPKYCPTYIAYMTTHLPQFAFLSPDMLYSLLVKATHDFYDLYVSRPHLQRPPRPFSWTLDKYILQAERTAVEAGLRFQRDPTAENLHQYEVSRDEMIGLQTCARTDSWQRLTDNINHQTSVGTMWQLIRRVTKRKPASALHHHQVFLAAP